MKYHFKTTDGRYLASATDLLWGLTTNVEMAAEFDSPLEASSAFLQHLSATERQGVSGGPVSVSDAAEEAAARAFLSSSSRIDAATGAISAALEELMDSYLRIARRMRDENDALRKEVAELQSDNKAMRRRLSKLTD